MQFLKVNVQIEREKKQNKKKKNVEIINRNLY